MGKLKQWWDDRSFYPKEASLANEGGDVRQRRQISASARRQSCRPKQRLRAWSTPRNEAVIVGQALRVRIVIAPDGQVTSINVVQGSGSSVLDAAALAVFRNAHLPPFPPGTPAQPADGVVTPHYHPAG
jgi:TonB family protein